VALRRWWSVWFVLRQDGWRDDSYKAMVGRRLKKLDSMLGAVRDWDVNLKTASAADLPQEIIDYLKERRRQSRKRVRSKVRRLKPKKILRNLVAYLSAQARQMRDTSPLPARLRSGEHLEGMLRQEEKAVFKLEADATTPEDLHCLRLAIKRWRYLLVEFFGLTSLELVEAQQCLGRLNDIRRLACLLRQAQLLSSPLERKLLSEERSALRRFQQIRKSLPFGLRPHIAKEPDTAQTAS